MRIAYVNGAFKKEDGVTTVIVNLIREAQKKNIETILVTTHVEDPSLVSIPIIQIPSVPFPLGKEYSVALPGISGFEKQLDDFKPDIIHLHSPDTIAWNLLKYARKNNIPIIATYHTDFVRYLTYYHMKFLKPLAWFLLERIYTRMMLVTTPSHASAEELMHHGIKNVQPVWWGIDNVHFNSSFYSETWRDTILGEKRKHIILCVCRLYWLKDLRTLAATYQLLKKDRDDFVMVIAGDGPARAELETLMPDAVFLGHVEGEELSRTYASSDIFLFPSSTETFGNVTIEALISGVVPVIAYTSKLPLLVEHGKNGLLAEPKNANDFYTKVTELLDNPDMRKQMREKGIAFAQQHSWDKVFDRFMDIYQKVKQQKVRG